jgi:hypothetical protein
MEHRSGKLEDLPPLALRPLRSLDVDRAEDEHHAAHIASASGVVRRGDFIYVIGDERLFLGIFRASDPGPGRLVRALAGTLRADADAQKAHKPDLEALTVVPPFSGHPFGAILGLGSGSGPGRDRGFAWGLDADGSLRGEVVPIDLAPLYRLLAEQVDELNIEGACVMGDRLWLVHRGNHGEATNVVAELSLEDVIGSLTGDGRIDPHELAAIRRYDLGKLDGVELTFSDATPIGGDILVFTASAEAQGDAGPDGAIRGSVVGTIDARGDVQRLRTIDRRWKVEGVHASIDTGVLDLLFVCDQDDPATASPLLSASMPIDAAVEQR